MSHAKLLRIAKASDLNQIQNFEYDPRLGILINKGRQILWLEKTIDLFYERWQNLWHLLKVALEAVEEPAPLWGI